MTYYTHIPSPVGILTAVCEDGFLTGIYLQPVELGDHTIKSDNAPVLTRTRYWLTEYFSGNMVKPDIPIKLRGTAFQKSVWKLLSQIPYGESVTYGDIAARLGKPNMSAQAVGQAVGRNPVAILIPCHRVLGVGGKLTGYAYGLDKKKFLLNLERIRYQ